MFHSTNGGASWRRTLTKGQDTGAAPQTVSGLRYLADVFHRLAAAVDGADTDPSTDVCASFAKHRALLDATLAQWARIKASGSTRAR